MIQVDRLYLNCYGIKSLDLFHNKGLQFSFLPNLHKKILRRGIYSDYIIIVQIYKLQKRDQNIYKIEK